MTTQCKLYCPLLAIVLACNLLSLVFAGTTSQAPRETVVIVVRHAEKASVPADDPPLTDAGRKRALALSHALSQAGVKAIFATQYQRTQQTVDPSAQAFKIGVTVIDATKSATLAGQVLEKHRGGVVLVAGHSNTIPDIIAALGGGHIPPIAESDYDDLFIVSIPGNGPSRVLHLQYGQTQ